MRQQILCETPKLILNRGLLSFLGHGVGYYTTDSGNTIHTYGYKLPPTSRTTNDFRSGLLLALGRHFGSLRKTVDFRRSLMDGCFFLNPISGETCPIFVEVPCGNCVICAERKRNAFGYRCDAESQMYEYPPMFITLTYKRQYLPPDCKLRYEDAQKFLKRLRTRVTREYNIPYARMRYACCGEYMPRNGYPHFHLILWGMPYIQAGAGRSLYSLIDKTWSVYSQKFKRYTKIGRTQVRIVHNPQGVGKYVGKYVSKFQSSFHQHGDEFLHCSCRNGGIGSSWIKANAHYFYDYPDNQSLLYLDKFTGKTHEMPMVKYFVDKIFPTVSMSIPQKLRESFGDFKVSLLSAQKLGLDVTSYQKFFLDLKIKLPSSLIDAKVQLPSISPDHALEMLDASLVSLASFANRDYSQSDWLHSRRQLYFSYVSQRMPRVDISHRADILRKRIAKQDSKYINC